MQIRVAMRCRTKGQAAIWLLGTLAASAAVMYAVFNTGQVIVVKQRAVNAADAAALAGAQAEARLLNLMAYGNRAIVANEVLLAQMLSMESWLQYVGRTAGNIQTLLNVLSLIPPVTAFAQAAAKVMGQAESLAEQGHDALKRHVIPRLITVLEAVKGGLNGAEMAINGLGGVVAGDAAKHLVAANRTAFNGRWDPGLKLADTGAVNELTLFKNNADWIRFTKEYAGNERADGKYILEQSRDRFTASRPGASWLNTSVFFFGIEKNGGATLQGYERWEHQDTLETWERVWCKTKWCKEYQPIGWGRSNAVEDENFAAGSTWAPNRSAQNLARTDGGKHGNWTGVPALYDVAKKSVVDRETLGLDFVVAVTRAGANEMTTTSLGMAGGLNGSVAGSPGVSPRQRSGQNAAFAKARVFFERPRRGLSNDVTASGLWRPDSAKEYGSLYSPYWQARLRDLTLAEKGAMLIAMGIPPDHALYTPGGQR